MGTLANAISQSKVEEVRPTRQRVDSVKEWTGLSLNETSREPEDRVAWRKRVSHVPQRTE